MADKKNDPTIKSDGAPEVSDADHNAAALEGTYRDNPDKPDPSTIAQVQDVPENWPTGQ